MLQTSLFSYYTKIQVSYKCSAWADEQNEGWGTLNLLISIIESLVFQHATLQTNFPGNSFLCVQEKHERKWAWCVPVCEFSKEPVTVVEPEGWGPLSGGTYSSAFYSASGNLHVHSDSGRRANWRIRRWVSPVTLLVHRAPGSQNKKITLNLNKRWEMQGIEHACYMLYMSRKGVRRCLVTRIYLCVIHKAFLMLSR